jgi:hypothetical protein
MADETQKRKAVAEKTVSNWLSKPYTAYTAHVEKQRQLLQIFCAYISEHGGWVSSAPNNKNWVRFEVPGLSEIPIRLREKNIPLAYIGESTCVNFIQYRTTSQHL